MSDPVPTGTSAGTITSAAARRTGLNDRCIIVSVSHDQVAAAVGAGAFDGSVAVDGAGTVECLTPIYDKIPEIPVMARGFFSVVPYVVPGKYVAYAFSYTGGALIQWAMETFGKGETNESMEKAYEKDEPTGCLFSKDDLTINGYGTLTVNGNYNNGIASKNDLKIVSGNITVTAKNNAIKGKDSFLMNSGTLVVNSDDDGIKVNEDEDISKGFICIEGGTVTVNAEDDALTAVYSVTITGGTVTTYVGGKAVNCTGTVNIAHGCLIEK